MSKSISSKVYIFIIILCISLIIQITACKPIEKKQPTEVPKTKEDFVKNLREILAPLHPPPSADTPTGLREEVRQQVLNNVFMFMQNNADNPVAQEACKEVAQEVSQWAKTAKEQQRWIWALACIDVFELLGAKSYALQRLRQQGEKLIAQPKVFVRGFLDDKGTGQTTIFVEVVNRVTGEKKLISARVGDEFENLRVVEIIHYKNVVRFEYTPIEGMFFEVPGPKF